MSKKLGTLAPIALAIALAAAACSGTEDDASAMRPTSAPQTTPTAQALVEPTEAPEVEETGLVLGETVIAPEGQRSTEVPLLTPVALRI